MKLLKLILPILLLPALPAIHAQEYLPETNQDWEDLRHTWKGFWITHPTAPLSEYGVFHFRKTFEIETLPEEFFIHVSADNRYATDRPGVI
jgi:alpha-L-rhamnosidase